MIFLDTSFLIASARKSDDYHERAGELYRQILGAGEAVVFSESILSEFVTFLRRHENPAVAYREATKILELQQWSMLFPTGAEVTEALSLLLKYGFASYTDALTVSIMRSRGVTKIVSFDSEFDKVPGIKRVF